MSHSYRRPYAAVTGVRSAHWDKTTAARGMRRAQNQYVRDLRIENIEWDETPIPHKLECHHNNNYNWGQDGRQSFKTISHNTYNVYYLRWSPCVWTDEELIRHRDERVEYEVRWIEKIQRK
jgi:hypothetical protein